VDLDAFTAVHGPEWDRLEQLLRRRRLNALEADELVELYQRAATHLSVVRSAAPDPVVAARLSRLVAQARAAVTGSSEPWTRELARFALVSFPAAVYRARWAAVAAAAFTIAVAVALGTWIATSAPAQAVIARQVDVEQLVESDFAGYYTQYRAGSFAAQVWTNNAWVAALCIALGVTGVAVVYVLFQNAVNVGIIGGIMAANGKLGEFFGFILPHGLLELTAVFVAAGAGLRLFWAWVDPGPLPRGRAMAREGRSMVTVALGLVVVLLVSGVVEGFVTPSGWPTPVRLGIGAAVWLAFLVYVGVFGRRAAAAGETGDLRAELAGDELPVAG
jgi:uncharacterized membrane protein SpoIIM required for sporulation